MMQRREFVGNVFGMSLTASSLDGALGAEEPDFEKRARDYPRSLMPSSFGSCPFISFDIETSSRP